MLIYYLLRPRSGWLFVRIFWNKHIRYSAFRLITLMLKMNFSLFSCDKKLPLIMMMNHEWLMRLVWSRSPTTLGILKITCYYIQLPLHRTIIYVNHTREGSSKTRPPLKYPGTIPNGTPEILPLAMKVNLPLISVKWYLLNGWQDSWLDCWTTTRRFPKLLKQ